MRQAKAVLALLVALAATGRPAGATTIDLETLTWQSRTLSGALAKFVPVEALELQKNQKVAGRFSVKLKFLNRGPAVQGLLIRYSMEAKIAPADHPDQAAWAIPFLLDERRVPKVTANSHVDVALDPSTMTEIYIKKLVLEGYVVQELRLRAMVFPRRGQTGAPQVLESELPVRWKTP